MCSARGSNYQRFVHISPSYDVDSASLTSTQMRGLAIAEFFLQSIEVARKGWWTMPRSFEHTDSYRRVFHQLCIVIKCCQKLQNCIKGYESLGLKRHLISVYRDPRSYRKMFFKIRGETLFLRCSSVTYCELRKTALANFNICGLANGFVNV